MACILNKTAVLYRATYYKNIIFGPVAKVTCVKNYGFFSPNKSNAMVEKRLRLKDNVTDDYKIIYREHNSLCQIISFSYYCGWACFFLGIISIGYLIIENPPLNTEVTDILGPIKYNTKLSGILVAIASISLPIVLVFISKIMPYRIYHSSSQHLYKAIFVNNILRKKGNTEIFCEHSAVPLFNRNKLVADTLFKINGRVVLLDRDSFVVQALREKMIYRAK